MIVEKSLKPFAKKPCDFWRFCSFNFTVVWNHFLAELKEIEPVTIITFWLAAFNETIQRLKNFAFIWQIYLIRALMDLSKQDRQRLRHYQEKQGQTFDCRNMIQFFSLSVASVFIHNWEFYQHYGLAPEIFQISRFIRQNISHLKSWNGSSAWHLQKIRLLCWVKMQRNL